MNTKKKINDETLISYIQRLIKEFQNTKIYIGARKTENLILVDQKIFDRFMKNKLYDMIYINNNRICLDIHPEAKNKFYNNNIYIPNNISRDKFPRIGEPVEINILYRWYTTKRNDK